MFADQTIAFSVTPVCPECGMEILTGGINVENDSICCSACGREMSFVEVMDYICAVQKKRTVADRFFHPLRFREFVDHFV